MSKATLSIALGLALGACSREPAPARPAASPAATASAPPPASPAAPSPAASPIAVWLAQGDKGAPPSPLAREWERELRASIAANPSFFRSVETEKQAELAVRIERVVEPKDSPGHQLLTVWLTVNRPGRKPTRWTLDYTGGPSVMAGRLARFLVSHVEEARDGGAPATPSAPPEQQQQPER